MWVQCTIQWSWNTQQHMSDWITIAKSANKKTWLLSICAAPWKKAPHLWESSDLSDAQQNMTKTMDQMYRSIDSYRRLYTIDWSYLLSYTFHHIPISACVAKNTLSYWMVSSSSLQAFLSGIMWLLSWNQPKRKGIITHNETIINRKMRMTDDLLLACDFVSS